MVTDLRGTLIAGAVVAVILPLVVPVLGLLLASIALAFLAALAGPEPG